MAFEKRHDECGRCIFWNAARPSASCLRCGAGEFFEEKIVEKALPDTDELFEIFAKMDSENEDRD